MVKYDCDYTPVPPCPAVPCNALDPEWGLMYEDVDYPVVFRVNGTGTKSIWSVVPSGVNVEGFVNVSDVGAAASATMAFTRVTPATGALNTGELVYVTLKIVDSSPAVELYLNWNQAQAAVLSSLILKGATSPIPGADTFKFRFAYTILCEEVIFSITPYANNPFPGPPATPVPVTPLVQLYTDNKRLPLFFTPYDYLGSFLWPIFESTPTVIKYRTGTATGTWVWVPPPPTPAVV